MHIKDLRSWNTCAESEYEVAFQKICEKLNLFGVLSNQKKT